MSKIFFLLWLALSAPPEIRVNWVQNGARDSLRIAVTGRDDLSAQCMRSGLELRYRYEVKFCRSRSYWLDGCDQVRRLIRTVQFNPVVEHFSLGSDSLDDKEDPTMDHTRSEEAAWKHLSQVNSFSVQNLTAEPPSPEHLKNAYVSLRLFTQCKGVYNETFERISYFISLGLVKTNGFDSGWISFKLDSP